MPTTITGKVPGYISGSAQAIIEHVKRATGHTIILDEKVSCGEGLPLAILVDTHHPVNAEEREAIIAAVEEARPVGIRVEWAPSMAASPMASEPKPVRPEPGPFAGSLEDFAAKRKRKRQSKRVGKWEMPKPGQWAAQHMTVDEQRAEMGLPPLEGKDEPFMAGIARKLAEGARRAEITLVADDGQKATIPLHRYEIEHRVDQRSGYMDATWSEWPQIPGTQFTFPITFHIDVWQDGSPHRVGAGAIYQQHYTKRWLAKNRDGTEAALHTVSGVPLL
jgi:hypothetical protein